MNVPALSTNGIKAMHEAIERCLAADDNNPSDEKEYGCRATNDWRQMGDKFEAELAARGESFTPLPW